MLSIIILHGIKFSNLSSLLRYRNKTSISEEKINDYDYTLSWEKLL